MNRLTDTNFFGVATTVRGATFARTATALIAGGIIALAGILPVSAAPPKTATHKTTHTVHHTTRKHSATAATRKTTHYNAAAAKPKQITIRGAAWNHPYANTTSATAPHIVVTVGKTSTASTHTGKVYPEGHGGGTGGVIQSDGTVVPGPSEPGLPGIGSPSAAVGTVPSIVAPPIDPGYVPPVVVAPPVLVPPTNGPAAPVTPAGPVVPVIP